MATTTYRATGRLRLRSTRFPSLPKYTKVQTEKARMVDSTRETKWEDTPLSQIDKLVSRTRTP